MLWFGWFGFNGGSALNSSLRSVYAACNTNFAAASGLFTWVLIDYIYLGKWSAVGAASGALAGLVGMNHSPITILYCSVFHSLFPLLSSNILSDPSFTFPTNLNFFPDID